MQVNVRFLLACELVSHTTERKLNIMGEFNLLANTQTPVVQPMMYIIGRIEASVTAGVQHSSQLIVTDEDGARIWESPLIPFAFRKASIAGLPMRADLVYQIGGMMFPKFGAYSFTLWINGVAQETAVVHVQQAGQGTPSAP
jgi:hypothetical protein